MVKNGQTGLARFNTQPPEGGWTVFAAPQIDEEVSTHSRPKAAGAFANAFLFPMMFQHTAARRRLALRRAKAVTGFTPFQHTAARRRLGR